MNERTEFVATQLRDFRAESQSNLALMEPILAELPAPEEPGVVIVKASPERVDEAICRALALACRGVLARVELI